MRRRLPPAHAAAYNKPNQARCSRRSTSHPHVVVEQAGPLSFKHQRPPEDGRVWRQLGGGAVPAALHMRHDDVVSALVRQRVPQLHACVCPHSLHKTVWQRSTATGFSGGARLSCRAAAPPVGASHAHETGGLCCLGSHLGLTAR